MLNCTESEIGAMPFVTVFIPAVWKPSVQALLVYTRYETVPVAFAVEPESTALPVTEEPASTVVEESVVASVMLADVAVTALHCPS